MIILPNTDQFERFPSHHNFIFLSKIDPSEAVRELNKRKSAFTIIIYASFEADYKGRSRAYLPMGNRIIIIKPDGTILIHEGKKREPVNWQPPGSRVSFIIRDNQLLIKSIRDRPRETLLIRVKELYFIAFVKLDTTGIESDVSEKKLVEKVLLKPELIEEGFRPIRTEVQTPFGYIDLVGEDKDGRLVVVEFKRVTAQVDAVYQLMRYIQHMKSNTRREIRGILVAPSITDRGKIIAKRYGLEFKKINVKELFNL